MTTMTQQARADAGPASRFAKWAPLAVVLSGTFIFVLDFFVVNVALPDIQGSLRASAAAIEWLVSGYALTTAALLVTGGRLGDHYGRRRWFSIGLAVFVLASALCAVAPDPGVLVAARVLQGAGAGVMAPNLLAILGMTYTGPDRVRAISVYGMVMGLAAVSGQLVGGLLIDANVAGLGWRAIFWINVPIGLAALAATPRLLRESRAEHAGRLDLPGAALLAVERSEITAFVPVSPTASLGPLDGPGAGVRLLEIPAVEAAVAVHEGPLDDIDRTYGALGTVVAERAIGVDGPIREYYLIGFPETEDESKHRTEVAWPVFRTG